MTRLTPSEALQLLTHADLHELGRLADNEVQRRFPDPVRTYIVDRNINYTNICTSRCSFCNFCRNENDPDAYVLSYDRILEKIDELVTLGGRQILLQGGHHPSLPLEWFLQMLRTIKDHFPNVHIHGFSPPEIVHMSSRFDLPVKPLLTRLQEAGLDTIPGGGAEILVDRVRKLISPNKCSTDQWLDVMRQAHRIGMRTTATMMFHHLETLRERVEHLEKLRELQDEMGGFTAFICWPFQSGGTRLAGQYEIFSASVQDYLKTLAISRIYLVNFPNIQASWVTQGPSIGQVALKFGANDFGSLMVEENVVASAGVRFRITEKALCDLIRQAGYQPARRNCYYQIEKSFFSAQGDETGEGQ